MWTVIVRDAGGQVVVQQEWKGGSLSIGREQGRGILLPSKTASRKHARLDLLDGAPVVVDEGSANGTLVNGVRIAAPTRVDESSKIDVAEFRITLLRTEAEAEQTVILRAPAAAPPPRPADVDPNSITAELDRHISGVRQYREQSYNSAQAKKQQLDHEWSQMIQAMNGLRARFANDKRVLAFNISRDLKEITLKIADGSEKRGYRYFLLSREHPDGKFAGMDSVWLREFGREDCSFHEPKKAMEELFSRIAGTLA